MLRCHKKGECVWDKNQPNKNSAFIKAKVISLLSNNITRILVEQDRHLGKVHQHPFQRIIEKNRSLASDTRTESTHPYWWDISNKDQEVYMQESERIRRSENLQKHQDISLLKDIIEYQNSNNTEPEVQKSISSEFYIDRGNCIS